MESCRRRRRKNTFKCPISRVTLVRVLTSRELVRYAPRAFWFRRGLTKDALFFRANAAEVKAKAKAKATAEEAKKKEEERQRLLEQVAAISPGTCALKPAISRLKNVNSIRVLTTETSLTRAEELIARLSAWKPGEPWPEGIPPPPPGWKPGDPLHFDLPKPRGDDGVGSLVKPTSTVAQAKPAARVVPFVSLDLNPDLDDDDVRSISDDFEEVSGSDGEDSD